MSCAYLTLAALLTGCGGGILGNVPTTGDATNAGVYPPGSKPFGRSYGEWSAAWWQWVFLMPVSEHPVLDATGEYAHVGQSGPVWFLAGTFGGVTERTCTIPPGKALFFPIINSLSIMTVDEYSMEQLRRNVSERTDHVTELQVTVDGRELRNLTAYRFQSPPSFYVRFPDDPDEALSPALAGGGSHESFADGYWVMLEPLAPGAHTIYFRGKSVNPGGAGGQDDVFETQMTYHLTVE